MVPEHIAKRRDLRPTAKLAFGMLYSDKRQGGKGLYVSDISAGLSVTEKTARDALSQLVDGKLCGRKDGRIYCKLSVDITVDSTVTTPVENAISPDKETSYKPPRSKSTICTPPTPPRGEEIDTFYQAWNTLLPESCGMQRLTKQRRAAIGKKLKNDPDFAASYRKALERAGGCPRLVESQPGYEWTITLDWFLRADKYLTILEGEWDSSNGATTADLSEGADPDCNRCGGSGRWNAPNTTGLSKCLRCFPKRAAQ